MSQSLTLDRKDRVKHSLQECRFFSSAKIGRY